MSEKDLIQATASRGLPQCDQLHAAEAEIERLQALVDGKFKEAYLMGSGASPDGGYQFDIRATIVPLMAEHLAQTLKGLGGENYVTIEFNHEEQGPLLLTIQRRFGEYPAQKAGRLTAEVASLRSRVEALETALNSIEDIAGLTVMRGDFHYGLGQIGEIAGHALGDRSVLSEKPQEAPKPSEGDSVGQE